MKLTILPQKVFIEQRDLLNCQSPMVIRVKAVFARSRFSPIRAKSRLDGCVDANVIQLKGVLRSLYIEHNQSQALVTKAIKQSTPITIDMDLTGRPVSKNAQGAKKGYFSRKRGIYGRQLARVLMPDTQEIIAEELYEGNRLSCQVFIEMLGEMEQALSLDTQEKRQQICLRLDGGFGTDKNINHAL